MLPTLIFSLKAYKASETKGFFPYDWFNHPDKTKKNKKFHPYDAFHNRLRNCGPLDKKYLDHEKLIGSGLMTKTDWSKWETLEYHLTEQRTNPIWRKWGTGKKCSHSLTFWIDRIAKTLCQLWKLCRKWSNFITKKVMICSNLNVLHLSRPTVQNFILSQTAKENCFQEFGKTCLEDH